MTDPPPHPVVVIPRFGKRQTLSKQAERDQELIVARVRENRAALHRVTKELEYLCGESPQKKDLLVIARRLGGKLGIVLDRLAKRSRDCLLCWFCENWTTVEADFRLLCAEQTGAFNSRNSCQRRATGREEPFPFPDGPLFDDFGFDGFFE
jgi:hypothetical protein